MLLDLRAVAVGFLQHHRVRLKAQVHVALTHLLIVSLLATCKHLTLTRLSDMSTQVRYVTCLVPSILPMLYLGFHPVEMIQFVIHLLGRLATRHLAHHLCPSHLRPPLRLSYLAC